MRYPEKTKQTLIAMVWATVVVIIGLTYFLVQRASRRNKDARTQNIRILQTGIIRSRSPQYRSAVITLNQILFHSGTHEIAQSKNEMVAAVKRWVENGAKEIFLIYTIFSPSLVEETKAKIICALKEHGISIPEHRVLFTATEQGRASVARQISPAIFLEPKEEIVTELVGKIEKPVHVKNVQTLDMLLHAPE